MNSIMLIIIIKLTNEMIIKDAVYDFQYKNMYFNYENNILHISDNLEEEINSNFRIKKILDNYNISFYFIEHINTNLNLMLSENNTKNIVLELINEKSNLAYWNFIKTNNTNEYIIQNKNNCYIKIKEINITCENISLENASHFNIIKIYEEVNNNKNDIDLIEKEPIDVLIKYIDLRDPFLKRDGIHQIKKDFDNEELRYCVRSILQNIPWVRKIFILMPNEKVRFFKDYKFISDKIIYIKDNNIINNDSSNSLAFQFRFWKLKKFGISDNFIAMDDDYFIGKSLNKTDFFFVSKGKVKPAIISSKFIRINRKNAKQKLKLYKDLNNKMNLEQNSPFFRYSLYLTYLYIINIFGEPLYLPAHTHNAIPINLKELREIYDLVYQSEYKYGTLYSLYRTIDNLQFQTLVSSYTFIKFKRKVKIISTKLINNRNAMNIYYNYSLFCINTGSLNYTNISFIKAKLVMQYLFPTASPYEIKNNFNLSFSTFNIIFSIEKELLILKKKHKINKLENELNYYQNQLTCLLNFAILILLSYFIYLKIIFRKKYKNALFLNLIKLFEIY